MITNTNKLLVVALLVAGAGSFTLIFRGEKLTTQACLEAYECDDANPCTDDWCAGDCQYSNNSAGCEGGGTCSGGVCVPPDPCAGMNCDDNNACTDDTCSMAQCWHTNNAASCDDGNPCTTGDYCNIGGCVGGGSTDCTDADPCTTDWCENGCQHNGNTGNACNDGNGCTSNDTCSAGTCMGGGNNTDPCEDGNPCTTGDACSGGSCMGGPRDSCDDSNVCTDDSCVDWTGCQHPANQFACDDGNWCTSSDACSNGTCGGIPVACSTPPDVCHSSPGTCSVNTCSYDAIPGCCLSDTECTETQYCDTAITNVCVTGCRNGVDADCSPYKNCTDHTCDSSCASNDGCAAGYGCAAGACLPVCGDGLILGAEACDDGGVTGGDGCSATCTVENGWSCLGTPSVCSSTCGDSIVAAGGEECDDGDLAGGDGCSATCTIESGYFCSGSPSGCTNVNQWNCAIGDGAWSTGGNWSWGSAPELGGNVSVVSCGFYPAITGSVTLNNVSIGADSSLFVADGGTLTVNGTLTIDGSVIVATLQIGAGGTLVMNGTATLIGEASVNNSGTITCPAGKSWNGTACAVVCGDGRKDATEACDDGDTSSDDGCSATCTEETGWSCSEDGNSLSSCQTTCGDGVEAGSEACDDGNGTNTDGCSNSCAINTGFDCVGIAPSVCTSTCGDGTKASDEFCDDGDEAAGDGCSVSCTVEVGWSCTGSAPSTCESTCGDGVLAGAETCDDGNAMANDGCSASCILEDGYTCDVLGESCDAIASSSSSSSSSPAESSSSTQTVSPGGGRGSTGTPSPATLGGRGKPSVEGQTNNLVKPTTSPLPSSPTLKPAAGDREVSGIPVAPSQSVTSEMFDSTLVRLHLKQEDSTAGGRVVAREETVTRARAVYLLLTNAHVPIKPGPVPFLDVRRGTPYVDALATATRLGILQGDKTPDGRSRGTVRPTDPVGQNELSIIIERMRTKGLIR